MDSQLSESSYLAFASFLHKNLGIVLGSNRQYLVRSRLTGLARDQQYTNLDAFLKDAISYKNRNVTNLCLELMTTNETFWFRDSYPFTLLSHHILPDIEKRQHNNVKKLRIWSSACASGQEPYSIAMIIAEYKRHNPAAFAGGVEILATDFSSKMVASSKVGIYDDLALSRGLSQHFKQRYFTAAHHERCKKAMQLAPSIMNMVKFSQFNLLNDFASLGTFDIIFCRNVLIYFDGKQKVEILNKFAACLPSQGTLLLGAAESIAGAEPVFKMQSPSAGLYFSRL